MAFTYLIQSSERRRDLQNHIGSADVADETRPIYSDILQKYRDLNKDEDLVNFFYEVLEKRSKLELKM